MKPNEFLNELRKIRTALFTIRVSDFIKKQDEPTRTQLNNLKLQIMEMVEDLETAELQQIADSLAQNEQGFKDAIADLKDALKDLDKAVAIINTISHVISVVNTIAGIII